MWNILFVFTQKRFVCLIVCHYLPGSGPDNSEQETLDEAVELAREVVEHIPVVMVTLGKYGVLLCRKADVTAALPSRQKPNIVSSLTGKIYSVWLYFL